MSAEDGFAIVGSDLVAETPFLRVEELSLRSPDGAIAARTVVRVGGAVALVPIDGDDVILIRQYRTPLDRAILELPAGKLDIPGEDPTVAARRELAEEVGFAAGIIEELVRYCASPGFSDEDVTVYLATDLTAVPMNRIGPEEEAAEVVRVPLTDVPALLGSIEDAKTVIGLQALLLRQAGVVVGVRGEGAASNV